MTIVLVSGMDFSGKTTTLNILSQFLPHAAVQRKFLTDRDPLKKLRGSNVTLSVESWCELWNEAILSDVNAYKSSAHSTDSDLILQDTLSPFKHYASICSKDNPNSDPLLRLQKSLMSYPDMRSVYLTVSYDERIRRFNLRNNNDISYSDKLVKNKELLEKTEAEYIAIIKKRFPETIVLDSTCSQPRDIALNIIKTFNLR